MEYKIKRIDDMNFFIRERKTGSWNHDDLIDLADSVSNVKGDFAEIGVYKGAAFKKIIQLAQMQNKIAHAFDSFEGMNAPCLEDKNTNFSLVILDVDHYQPTVEALYWVKDKINIGGLLCLDDYSWYTDELASKAITEFLAHNTDFEKVAEFNQQLILRKKRKQ